MKKVKFLSLFFLFICLGTLPSQNQFGTQLITNNAYEGYTLFSIHKKVYLINNCGQVVNEWSSNYLPGNSVYLLPNGNILRAGRVQNIDSAINFGGRGGIAEIFDWEGNLVWSYKYISNEYRQHHDIYPMPNGNVLILAATVVNNSDAIQAGRDPSKLSGSVLFNEQIIEVEPLGINDGNIVWEWNVMDHIIQDLNETKDNYGVVANNPNKLDINFLNGLGSGSNWLHVNSIQYDDERDQIVISSRRLCELYIIDHSTTTIEAASNSGGIYGNGGDFLYRWGNPAAYRQGSEEQDRQFFGQHMPYIIPAGLPNEGKIIVFNNGNGRTPLYSEINILEPPITQPGFYNYESNTAFGPTNSIYTYPENIPDQDSEFFSQAVSSAQQLPNENILICKGDGAQFIEIDNNNDIVWEYLLPINQTNGLPFPENTPESTASFTFRALKYSTNYPAFEGRDLTFGEPLEINPNIDFCIETLNNSTFDPTTISFYPNPAKNFINIQYEYNIDKIVIYDLNGNKVLVGKSNFIKLNQLENGIYFLKIFSGNLIKTKKIIKN